MFETLAISRRQIAPAFYTCDFEAATLARQKLHRVAVTKIACVNRPLRAQGKKSGKTDLFCPVDLKTRHKTRRSKILSWL